MSALWTVWRGEGPLVAVALHAGHEIRSEVASFMALDDGERQREEDPYTGSWTTIAPNRVIVHRSRFEVDLNRPRDQAIYLKPEQAWGLHVWNSPLPPALVARCLNDYDAFYGMMFEMLSELRREYGRFVVLDLHSYNYRRQGPKAPPAPDEENPEINVGTGTMERQRWRPLVERFIRDLGDYAQDGRSLDVRENVRFRGGFFPRWVHETFPDSGCALAIEVKKFFMDEWTGQPDVGRMRRVHQALESTLPGILEELQACGTATPPFRRTTSSRPASSD